jgi:hypothetical protein
MAKSAMNRESDPAPSNLAVGTPVGSSVWDDVRLQKLWLSTQRREWRSLALVGANNTIDTLWIAELIANLAWSYRGTPSCVFDLRDMSLRLVKHHEEDVAAQVRDGQIVTIALRSIYENPTAVPMARSADAVLLCVGLGTTDIKLAEQTITEIGRDRVIGAIVVRPPQPASRKRNGK